MDGAVRALQRVDGFLEGYLSAAPPNATLLIASDHGNIEDVREGHTRNPSLGVVIGADAERRAGELASIMDVPAALFRWMEA